MKKNFVSYQACNIVMSTAATLACHLLSKCSLNLAGGGSVYLMVGKMTFHDWESC